MDYNIADLCIEMSKDDRGKQCFKWIIDRYEELYDGTFDKRQMNIYNVVCNTALTTLIQDIIIGGESELANIAYSGGLFVNDRGKSDVVKHKMSRIKMMSEPFKGKISMQGLLECASRFKKQEEQPDIIESDEIGHDDQNEAELSEDFVQEIDEQTEKTADDFDEYDKEEEALAELEGEQEELSPFDEEMEEYEQELENNIRKIIESEGFSDQFTNKEKMALRIAFKKIKFSLRGKGEDDDEREIRAKNFVRVKRTKFSAMFLFKTDGIDRSVRDKLSNIIADITTYKKDGNIIDSYEDETSLWAVMFITKMAAYSEYGEKGTELINYPHLGDFSKCYIGFSKTKNPLIVNMLEQSSRLTLIGGKSRSGKTCLSHTLIIQQVCAGIVPFFADWKPEGSDVYRARGFAATTLKPDAWTLEGQKRGDHLINLLEFTAMIYTCSYISNSRVKYGEFMESGKVDFSVEPPVAFIWDEMEAFATSLTSIKVKGGKKNLTDKEKAADATYNYCANRIRDFVGQLRVCANRGVFVVGITQDLYVSKAAIFSSTDWNGSMLLSGMMTRFYGRGTSGNLTFPEDLKKDEKGKEYIEKGIGRFAGSVNGVSHVFRAPRIDNAIRRGDDGAATNADIQADTILDKCLEKLDKPLNTYADFIYSKWEEVKQLDEYVEAMNAIRAAYGSDEESEGQEYEDDDIIGGGWEPEPTKEPTLEDLNDDQASFTEAYNEPVFDDESILGDLSDVRTSSTGEYNELSFDDEPILGDLSDVRTSSTGEYNELSFDDEDILDLDDDDDDDEYIVAPSRVEPEIVNAPRDASRDDSGWDSVDDSTDASAEDSRREDENSTDDRRGDTLDGLDSEPEDDPNEPSLWDAVKDEAPRVKVNNQREMENVIPETGREVTTSAARAKQLTRDDSIDCTKAPKVKLGWAEELLCGTPAGTDIYINKVFTTVLDAIAQSINSGAVKRIGLFGGNMYVNGKIVNLNGVLGGSDNLRLIDIVNFNLLFKKFKATRELILDMDMLKACIMENGLSGIEDIFDKYNKLSDIYIYKSDSNITRIERGDLKNNRRQPDDEAEKMAKVSASFAQYNGNIVERNWKKNTTGKKVWGIATAKRAYGYIGDGIWGGQKLNLGKGMAAAVIGTGVAIAGGAAWLAVNGVGTIFGVLRGR